MNKDEIKKMVREGYGEVAMSQSGCCGPSSCCGGTDTAETISKGIGYSEEDIKSVPEGANLGLGCGNPVALASLKKGETVIDLGSGAGFDCFLAADKVGREGRVIGVDMTSQMLEKAKANAAEGDYANVEFRLGEIENLPVADNFADVIISNCIINLSPDKPRVFAEAFRTLKPGGRLMVSDIVLLKELPAYIIESVNAYVGCLSGAMLKDDYLEAVRQAGFESVKVNEESSFAVEFMANDPTVQKAAAQLGTSLDKAIADIEGTVLSVKVSAIKPR